jgi:hypothetical protein
MPPKEKPMAQDRLSVALIKRFASLYACIDDYRPTLDAAVERREIELTRMTGIQRHWSIRTDDEAKRHMDAMRIVDEEIGFGAVNEQMEALEARLDPLVKIITDTPARDLTGLALKANALASVMSELWTSIPEELDYPEGLVRDLIENICAVAGVDLAVNQRLSPRADLN